MIINIAGTSGSGKSYLMRQLIDWIPWDVVPDYLPGRKPPIGYKILRPNRRQFYLLGAYEDADTAGCDTIRSVDQAFGMIWDKSSQYHVLYEGLIMMNHTRGPQLAAEFGNRFQIIQLKTPYSVCIASINARRQARGEGPIRDKSNTKGNYVRAENYCTKMRAQGASVIPVYREEALDVLARLVDNCP